MNKYVMLETRHKLASCLVNLSAYATLFSFDSICPNTENRRVYLQPVSSESSSLPQFDILLQRSFDAMQ